METAESTDDVSLGDALKLVYSIAKTPLYLLLI